MLPDWWEDKAADSVDGAWELVIHLARCLSLDATALSKGIILPTGAVSNISFKRNAAIATETITASSLLASSLSYAILSATKTKYRKPTTNAMDVHQAILNAGNGTADFDGLLSYCWSSGIPVIPLSNLPVGLKKMDGAALQIGDRPVIVIARKNDSKSWLSFILAHELGHIALGHLQQNSSIIDVSLQKESTFAADKPADRMEKDADTFALDILGGPLANEAQSGWNDRDAATKLAVNAREAASRIGCSAGHLILRYAFRTRRWPEAISALKFLREDFDAQQTVVEKMSKYINFDDLAGDMQDLISKVTGIVAPNN